MVAATQPAHFQRLRVVLVVHLRLAAANLTALTHEPSLAHRPTRCNPSNDLVAVAKVPSASIIRVASRPCLVLRVTSRSPCRVRGPAPRGVTRSAAILDEKVQRPAVQTPAPSIGSPRGSPADRTTPRAEPRSVPLALRELRVAPEVLATVLAGLATAHRSARVQSHALRTGLRRACTAHWRLLAPGHRTRRRIATSHSRTVTTHGTAHPG